MLGEGKAEHAQRRTQSSTFWVEKTAVANITMKYAVSTMMAQRFPTSRPLCASLCHSKGCELFRYCRGYFAMGSSFGLIRVSTSFQVRLHLSFLRSLNRGPGFMLVPPRF